MDVQKNQRPLQGFHNPVEALNRRGTIPIASYQRWRMEYDQAKRRPGEI
jgi:hypothetical protein